MIVNFVNIKAKKSNQTFLIEKREDSNQTFLIEKREESSLNCSLVIVSFMVLLLYFLFNVVTVFFDFIFGFMDVYDYNPVNPLVKIKSWLIVNGIFGYIGLILLVILGRIYTENNENVFARKTIKISCYFINGFLVVWTSIGMVSFFVNYYNMNTSHKFFYNYLLIRIIIAPIISVYKLAEIYFI